MRDNDPTDIHSTYLHWVAEASPYRLAEIAECAAPDSATSPGAEILEEVRNAVVDAWVSRKFDWETDRNDGDVTPECAEEGIIPVESHQRALLFVDLCAYREENEFTDGTWSGTIEDIMVDAISQITERAARLMIMEIRKDFKDLWECPLCGDAGEPHICLPGECNGSEEEQEAYAASQATSEPADTPTPTQGTPDTGEAVSVAAGHLRDPLYRLLADKPDGFAGLRSTEHFLADMAKVNQDEFSQLNRPFGWLRRPSFWVAVTVLSAIVAVLILTGGF